MPAPSLILMALSNLCWAYALILGVDWLRAVGRRDRREHIGCFVDLMGIFVPGIILIYGVLFVGTVLNAGWLSALVIVLFPAAIAAGLHLELARLVPADRRRDNRRMAITVGIATAMTLSHWA
ncbi:MAG: hypothetical protein OIF47_15185 [Marinibacterium sp.]|nr:hypothetical protein [Marinibacterium sp.]